MTRRACLGVLIGVLLAPGLAGNPVVPRASLVLRVSPPVAMAPAKISVFAELQGGSDDDPEYYCPTLEWDWDDGSVSERSEDCPPFEAGKTTIRRRFLAQHEYKRGGSYQITLRLKRGDRTLLAGQVNIQISGGGAL